MFIFSGSSKSYVCTIYSVYRSSVFCRWWILCPCGPECSHIMLLKCGMKHLTNDLGLRYIYAGWELVVLSMLLFGTEPSWDHCRDWETRRVFHPAAHHTWTRWSGVQRRQIDDARRLHPLHAGVQGCWSVRSLHGVYPGHRVHRN